MKREFIVAAASCTRVLKYKYEKIFISVEMKRSTEQEVLQK